jgi:hypothetical protein
MIEIKNKLGMKELSLCPHCHCMTHTLDEKTCGKCKGIKITTCPLHENTGTDNANLAKT